MEVGRDGRNVNSVLVKTILLANLLGWKSGWSKKWNTQNYTQMISSVLS